MTLVVMTRIRISSPRSRPGRIRIRDLPREKTPTIAVTLRESEYGPLEDRAFLRLHSPIHKADRIRGALLVVHGETIPGTGERGGQILKAVGAWQTGTA